ncbi:MAG: hypothetical protein HDQ87_08760 [Clostridia bacterium]|nr:hypothetical protein [Clostridia bacterium]
MMYSDYYALSSCAIGVVFIPFMVVCLLRYGLILQAFNYSSRTYFVWLRCSFAFSVLPLAGVCGIALLWQLVLGTYLTHTAATELMIILGYAGLMLLGIAAVCAGFGRFCRRLGIAGSTVPRIEDRRLVILFLASSLAAGVLILLLNLELWQLLIYFVPLLTPFLVPLVNAFFRPYPGAVVSGVGFDEEPLGKVVEEAMQIDREPAPPVTRRALQEESVSQDTRLYHRTPAAAGPETDIQRTGGQEKPHGEDQDDHPAGGD